MKLDFCKETHSSKGVLISLHILPRGKKTEIIGIHGSSLKVKVSAPPSDGKANDELISFFSKEFKIAKSKIYIKYGEFSKQKVLEIAGLSLATFTQYLLTHKILTLKLG